ncbi:MAG: hypothetical protein Q7S54_00780 [bacterium]|nr:hypothetical protein [bacterium]
MKKVIVILLAIVSIIIIAFLGWYFLLSDQEAPITEVIKNSLPFGSGEGLNGPTADPSTTLGTSNQESFDEFSQPTANLFRLAVEPVAGAVVFNKSSSTQAVRYVDRATGNIFELILPKNSTPSGALEKKRITNKTLPKIYEAYFRPDGNAVLLRSLRGDSDVIENLSLTLAPPAFASTSTDGLYSVSATTLRGDIGSIVVGAGNTLYYSLKDSRSIVSSAFNNPALKTILTSPFTNWRLVAAGNALMIYTKASANAPGYAYTLNATTGALTKLLGPLNGLTVVPDTSGTRLVYSYIEGGTAKSSAKNLQSGAVIDILPVTLAEKCIWSTRNRGVVYCGSPVNGVGGNEPDNWYKGVTHFSDRLWRFDTNAEIAQILSEPKASLGVDLDVYEPRLSPAEDYLIFTNKTDLSLWALKLEQF